MSNKDRMVRQKPFLKSILRGASHARRKALVDYANRDQINAVSELVLNTLKGHVPISQATHQRLERHKTTLRKLAQRTTSLKAKKRLLNAQKGGGFWQGLDCCHRQCRI